MKILHINDTYAMTGGIARYLFEVMALLEQQGHENVVIYQQEHERTVTDHRAVYYTPSTDNHNQFATRQSLHHILDKEKPDTAFLHAVYDPDIVAQIAAHLPTVAYIHGFHTVCPGLAKYFRRNDTVCTQAFGLGCIPMIYARRCSDARHPRTIYQLMRKTTEQKQLYQSIPLLIVASQYMHNLLQQNGFAAQKIAILPYPHTPADSITAISTEEPLRIFYAGRLEIEKGIPYLLQAFARLTTPCKLHIAGDGTLRSTYEAMANELGIASRVKFLGWLNDDDLDKEYQVARVVVMPSIFPEPFGQVGVHALLRERPVIAFNVGGIPDWLRDGEHGFLVPAKDVDALANRIEVLLNDALLAAKLGKQGREFALQAYAPQAHINQLLKMLQNITGLR